MAPREPGFVTAVLNWRPVWLVARLALCSAYLIGAATKLGDWPGAVAEQVHFGIPFPQLAAALTIAIELVGPALILSGRLVWLGAGMLGVFTLLAAFVANPFWTMTGQERFFATNSFFEHLGLVAAFVLVAMLAGRDRIRA